MTVLDWNSYSAHHPSWFASDEVHLSGHGSRPVRDYVHRWLKRMGLTGRLPLLDALKTGLGRPMEKPRRSGASR